MSHFTVLVPVAPPMAASSVTHYTPEEMQVIAELKAVQKLSFQQELRLKELTEKVSPMEKLIEEALSKMLAPFDESSEDPEYLEFVNTEDENRQRYETECVLQIRMPDGTLHFDHDREFCDQYQLHNGKVYPKESGKTNEPPFLRSVFTDEKPAGQPLEGFEVIENYPLKELYPTFAQYMEEYCGESFDEKQQAYGYYHNPNATWDWWQIGGRWQNVFLVSDQCLQVVYGGSGVFGPSSALAPTGYRWVAGARKADVQWELMKELKLQNLRKSFQVLEKWFWEDVEPQDHSPMLTKTEDGICDWGEMAYKKGETCEEYIRRNGANPEIRYPCSPYAFVDEDGWHGSGDMRWFGISSNNKAEELWNEEVDAFIASIPDDYYLVSVDCHI